MCDFKCTAEGAEEEGTILEFDVSFGEGGRVEAVSFAILLFYGFGFFCWFVGEMWCLG